jgi:hypothetical protein
MNSWPKFIAASSCSTLDATCGPVAATGAGGVIASFAATLLIVSRSRATMTGLVR